MLDLSVLNTLSRSASCQELAARKIIELLKNKDELWRVAQGCQLIAMEQSWMTISRRWMDVFKRDQST